MQQTPLQIMPAAARSAHKKADPQGKQLLEELLGKEVFSLSIMKRIKTFEDVCAEAGEDPKRFMIPTNATPRQRGEIAAAKVMLICEVFREGVQLDYADSNQYKYYPYFKYVPGSGFSFLGFGYAYAYSGVGARLSVDSRAKAEYIGNTFIKEYNDFLLFQ